MTQTQVPPMLDDKQILGRDGAYTLLWWDYSEGGSKYGSGCLNFDQGKKVIKMSREVPYKEIHVIF